MYFTDSQTKNPKQTQKSIFDGLAIFVQGFFLSGTENLQHILNLILFIIRHYRETEYSYQEKENLS